MGAGELATCSDDKRAFKKAFARDVARKDVDLGATYNSTARWLTGLYWPTWLQRQIVLRVPEAERQTSSQLPGQDSPQSMICKS